MLLLPGTGLGVERWEISGLGTWVRRFQPQPQQGHPGSMLGVTEVAGRLL